MWMTVKKTILGNAYSELCSVSWGVLKFDPQSEVQVQGPKGTGFLDAELVSCLLDDDLQVVMGSQLPLDHVDTC